MSKDPAFLFYSSDFLTGTMLMDNMQVGIYIRLLCIQHQHGGIIDKTSFNSMVGSFDIIRSKFIESEDGFFNERLMQELEKRAKKSSNLSANAKIRWDKHKQKQCKSNAIASYLHMPIENENESININKGKPKNLEEVETYFKEQQIAKFKEQANKFYNFYEAKGWMIGKNKIKNWKACMKTWNFEKASDKKKFNNHNNQPVN